MFMAQGDKKSEDFIIEILHAKDATGPALLAAVQKKESLSKETFYRILRKLLAEEVVTKYRGTYQLNRHWMHRIYRFAKKHIETEAPESILSFKDGDSVTYRFKTPNQMGIYWAHTYDIIFDQHDPSVPILIFHPHEWLIHTRTASEKLFLNRFTDDKKTAIFSIGGTSKIDKQFKKEWSGPFVQVSNGINHGLKNTEYLNVLGDFIFKVTLTKRFGDRLDAFFTNNPSITEHNIRELQRLCNGDEKVRMVLTRSKKEAAKWHAKFDRHFVAKRQIDV